MTKEQVFKEIKRELEHIKNNATMDEINKLNFDTFNKDKARSCIYGQMTGKCTSERAFELCPKVLGQKFASFDNPDKKNNVVRIVKNGYYTFLERFLFECGSKVHKNIYDYLEDKTDIINIGNALIMTVKPMEIKTKNNSLRINNKN